MRAPLLDTRHMYIYTFHLNSSESQAGSRRRLTIHHHHHHHPSRRKTTGSPRIEVVPPPTPPVPLRIPDSHPPTRTHPVTVTVNVTVTVLVLVLVLPTPEPSLAARQRRNRTKLLVSFGGGDYYHWRSLGSTMPGIRICIQSHQHNNMRDGKAKRQVCPGDGRPREAVQPRWMPRA